MKKIKQLILVSLLFSNVFVGAEDSKEFTKCMKASDITNQGMLACIYDEYKREDIRLNKNYRVFKKELSLKKQKELQSLQKLWIEYRDKKCDFYYDLTGGTIDRLNHALCLLETTKKRADELDMEL